jgi:transcriptional antiterminator NusG
MPNTETAKWYVVHTYSGHENKVKVNLEKIVDNRGMMDIIQEVRVPMEDVTEIKNGKQVKKQRKIFPGYVLVKMIMNDQSWYIVRNTKGVTGFVGPGSKPVSLTDHEIKNMGIEEKLPEIDVKVGEFVRILHGPFNGMEGFIEVINKEKRLLRVKISLFGRETPVELEYTQIHKL